MFHEVVNSGGAHRVLELVRPYKGQAMVADLAKPYAERSYDAYVVTLGWIADLASEVEDLSGRIAADTHINWADIPPFFQKVSTLDDKIMAVILDGDQQLVYYRADLFDEQGFPAPKTWNDYIAYAQFFDGKDLNGDGIDGDYGSCFAKTKGGIAYNMFFSMLASQIQSQGTDQGVFFSADDMTPNFDTASGRDALFKWFQTFQYGADHENVDYGLTEQRVDFLGGRCALTIDWGDTGAYSFTGEIPTSIAGKLGTIALPGSYFAMAADGERRQCDSTVCPFADSEGINRAPFGANGGGHGGFIAADAPQSVRDAAYNLFSWMSINSLPQVLQGSSGFDPYRFSHLHVSDWVGAGMEQDDAELYVGAFSDSLSNENFAYDLRIPGTALYQKAVDEGLRRLTSGATVDEAARYMQMESESITDAAGRQDQFDAWRVSLGLAPEPLPSPHPTPSCSPVPCVSCPANPPCRNGGSENQINFIFDGMISA